MITKLSGRFSDGLKDLFPFTERISHEHFETVDRCSIGRPLGIGRLRYRPCYRATKCQQNRRLRLGRCGIVGALTHGGKGARNSALACGAIGAGVGGYMDYQAKKLRESLANTDVKVEQQGNQIKLVMPENVTFATNSATLSANARDALTAASKTLVQYPDTTLTINGHTDNTGSDAINDPLSRNRAQSVASFLQSQGVAGSRLTTAGHGSRQPVASNATPEGRAQNRRVEILINPDQNAIKAAQQ